MSHPRIVGPLERESPTDSLYTPLREAVRELHRRRKDRSLCRAVEQFHSDQPRAFLAESASAILVRAVFSADYEFERFVTLSSQTGLTPRCLEITKDRFVSFNRDKYCRGKLTFRWENHVRALRVLDFAFDGKRFEDIPSVAGYPVTEFHRKLLTHAHPSAAQWIHDFSDWMQASGRVSPRYLRLLALALTDGVLFENFLWSEPEEQRFVEQRVIPSFARVIEIFGVKPLIVRLFTPEEENDPRWCHYPGDLYEFARHLLSSTSTTEAEPNRASQRSLC